MSIGRAGSIPVTRTMNLVETTVTVITEQPQLVVLMVIVSVVVTACIAPLFDQGVVSHEELVADSQCQDHSIWHLTWPKVDDEWTGVVNIVCNRCNHTEKVPSQWSLIQF